MRYSRNAQTITKQEQEYLATKKVLVIGLGGLGSFVIEGLARIGIVEIGICDYDFIEESNLNRQLLAFENSLGETKLALAQKRIQAINSKIKVYQYPKAFLNPDIENDLDTYDLVIDCLDNIMIRKQLENVCLKHNKQIVYGTVAGNYGYFGVISQDNQLMSIQSLQPESKEQVLGNLFYTVGIVASMQVLLAIKVLLNKKYLKNGFYTIDLEEISIEHVTLN